MVVSFFEKMEIFKDENPPHLSMKRLLVHGVSAYSRRKHRIVPIVLT